MDAVRFGRWISERRLKCGWRSQRALVETTRQDSFLSEFSISEDFLARLEAGQLAHPFRGSVRRRVLALAWLLCKAPRDVRTYLQAAELSELKADEAEWVNRLRERLAARNTPTLLSLPPRPTRLLGRTCMLQDLVKALCTGGSDLYAITGMPGVGKSTLAHEALHQLASNERERLRLFPDGIVTFAAAGRQGSGGLMSLLNEITAVLAKPGVKAVHAMTVPLPVRLDSPEALDGELAGAIDRVRLALADKRLLLLLDDLDAQFPLRQALRALLSHGQNSASSYNGGETGMPRCVVLTTSRYIPAPSLATYHLHLGPLEPGAALELFTALVGRSLDLEERGYAERVCAAIGYLPLAIEAAVASVEAAGIPLSLLAARVAEHPLDMLLDGERELHSTLTQALDVFDPEMQQRFALLATLGVSSFGIESAAAIRAATTNGRGLYNVPAAGRLYMPDYSVAISGSEAGDERGGVDIPVARLADAASDLGQFVRHSLVEPESHNSPGILHTYSLNGDGTRYSMHPLLHAYAVERLNHLEPEIVHTARGDAWAYALAYVERYRGDLVRLEHEREFLLTALAQIWQQEQYGLVVRFVSSLGHFINRLAANKTGERILLWGVEASQQIHDRYHTARFLNHLGVLLVHHTEFARARQVWERSLEIAETLGRPTQLWYPLANAAYLATTLGEYDAARRFADAYLQRNQKADDDDGIASGLLARAQIARLQGEIDRACDDLSSCVRLFSSNTSFNDHLFELQVSAEFARVRGYYERSKEYTQTAVSLVEGLGDYCVAELLFDQAHYAHQQGMLDDARTLALDVVAMAKQVGSSHLHNRGMMLLQRCICDMPKKRD